jgi:hypothetical protein
MFINETLKTHLETSATIQLRSLVLAEWNMNMPDNIFLLGNYRYRPTTAGSDFFTLPVIFDSLDSGGYYTGATDADVVVDGGFDNNGTPQQFTLLKEKMKMLYSLEDCIKPFRPRSGINKPLYFSGSYLPNSGSAMAQRPRWYMPSRYDQFRYWTSYRTEDNVEYGIAKNISNALYYIDDAVPFVVYKNQIPANRLVVKMQTGVGTIDLGPYTTSTGSISDPLYGNANRKTPARWRIQYLNGDNWIDAYTFTENDTREDGSPIIAPDGYVELQYGLIIPNQYKDTYKFMGSLSSSTLLPDETVIGNAFLIVENTGDLGTFYIWDGDSYETFTPEYGWILGSETITNETSFVTDLTSPSSFTDPVAGGTSYREFQYMRGIRIVVDVMNKFDSTFDLIEFSPRLLVDLSDKTIQYDVTKILSDVGVTSLPVGQLLASTGTMSLFDDDQAFNENNSSSIIADYVRKNIKFLFYEVVSNVEDTDGFLYDYYIPIKTMYSEGLPQADLEAGSISIQLRDFYFFLESMPAPRLLLTESSLSFAITTLLDYIGFTNYTFRRIEGESDPVIPYFFVAPDQNVAEVLNQLAVATQTAMFFDEYNNFVVMSKNYLMPTTDERPTDFVLLGNNNQSDTGVIENSSSGNLPNIISIASQDKKIYNDGKISYTTRYLQRSYGSIRQASMIDREKTWIYKPALLWEVAGTENTKTINEVAAKQGNYVLGAMPINSNLPATPPIVSGGVVINNTIDLGESVYWLTRYQGYFYANGEIIRFDAAEFNITGTGNVYISSNQEYQRYFSTLPFNGKIYPTGLVRIYSVPFYEIIDGNERLQPGAVYEHGRGQFGTPIVEHTAGISSYWSDSAYIRGCNMQAQYMFTTELDPTVPSTTTGAAGVNNDLAKQTTRNGIIKNFMSTTYLTETAVNDLKSTQAGTMQSSALIMNGPSFKTTETPLNFVSYVYKNLDDAYRLFGTRFRIIGKVENNENRAQTPIGSTSYYQVTGALPNQNISIGGGSGGLAVLLNPETNNGYYFEIVAMTEDNIESYITTDNAGNPNISINNVVFYKIKKDSSNNDAIPVKLWGGLANIIVDDGRFTGQYRMSGEENSTVYDLSVEYEDIGTTRRFYLYINNKLIQIVDDTDPLPIFNNIAPFVRGSSRVMFENVYALAENYSQNTVFTVGETLSSVFGDKAIDANESFRKYAMSGIIQATYLTGISSEQPPKYNMYFDEFGTIMRECAYFDIRYDRSYPALYAQLSPTLNRIKGYTVSGFQADSYGAEFLIFNATDTALNLDETTGNYLRIQGVTFTQDTSYQLTVDEYFRKTSNLSNPQLQGSAVITSPLVEKVKYDDIKQSRMIYGKNEFAIESPYIQTEDDAQQLMGWIINKVMVPKKAVGINMFSIPTLQLGDIVTINYEDSTGLDLVAPTTDRFVIYNIKYGRNIDGPNMTIYLSEV